MRYQLQTTTSCGAVLTATLHVVVLTEPHDNEPCAVPTIGSLSVPATAIAIRRPGYRQVIVDDPRFRVELVTDGGPQSSYTTGPQRRDSARPLDTTPWAHRAHWASGDVTGCDPWMMSPTASARAVGRAHKWVRPACLVAMNDTKPLRPSATLSCSMKVTALS